MPATLDTSEDDNQGDVFIQSIFEELDLALEAVKSRGDVADASEVSELQQIFRDPRWQAMAKVHDSVSQSQGLEQPVDEGGPLVEQFTATEPVSKEEQMLFALLQRPHVKALIESHDMVKDRKYLPQVPIMDAPFYPTNTTKTNEGSQQRTVGLYKEPDQPLGITLKMVEGKVVIARILHGGLIYKQGLLQVGDQIVKVSDESVGSMTPIELQEMLKGSSGSIVITVEPSVVDASFFGTQVYMRVHFDYKPDTDRLIPSREAGLPFDKGDIVEVLGQDDTFWWQACKYGSHSAAGLIPSQQLEERRRAYNLGENGAVGCLGRRKQKRQLLYSSHHNGLFEPYDVVLYEKVSLVPNFKRKTLILIGSQCIGRRQLKSRLVEDVPDKYGEVKAYTTRERQKEETMDGADGYFHVSEDIMKADIQAHKFIEYGRHQQQLYGIKSDTIEEVMHSGKMVVLEVYPQTVKMLRTSKFCPLIVYIKPSSLEGLRQLYQNVAMQQSTGQKLTDTDFQNCLEEAEQIEKLYSHFFDATIVNEDIDIAYEELLTVIKKFTTGPQWVPTGWVM